jgi:hypothetical protein
MDTIRLHSSDRQKGHKMSLEAWGDEGRADDMFTQDAVDEIVAEAVEAARAPLIAAIAAIYRAPVYAEQKRENGVSLEFISALYSAAEVAGLKQASEPLSPVLSELSGLLETLEKRHIYPKMLGNDIYAWLTEAQALIAATNPDRKAKP